MLRNASTIAPGAAQDQKDRETIDQLTDRGLAALGHEPMPVWQAIKAKCLDCSCGNASEVRDCLVRTCPFVPGPRGPQPMAPAP